MAIKQTTNGPNAQQRFRLIGRLSKAVKWADLFSRACAEKADPKTAYEATVPLLPLIHKQFFFDRKQVC